MLTVLKRPRRTDPRMPRASWIRASILALFAVVTAGSLADAARAADARARFTPLTGDPSLTTHAKPLSMDGSEPVKVVVRLQSESVAEARARSATHEISADEERAVVSAAHREHAAIGPAIQGLGGRVVAEYQHALNGVAVVMPRGQIATLATLPGVRSVHRVNTYTISNSVSVPYLDAPAVWQGHPGLKGEGVKIAIIDTGIDYTHADFGGPGTPAAFATAAAASTAPADPTLFGPNAPKVKGGIDLVGDAYDAGDPTSVPVPDPNPLDCNGHGSHVAGTAAGFGVANGTTYTGPYAASAYAATHFDVGPGVAPKADLYAVRVFGCSGSTNVVTEAIDWAVRNHMDVISMSLGSPFGTGDSADAIAADNATRAGITVVAAAGNEGPAPYIAGTPAAGTHVIAAAAMDARAVFANGVRITMSSGAVDGLEANSAPLPTGSVPLVVLTSGSGLALGCPDASGNYPDYPPGISPGAVVIVGRGTCTFVQKAAGAAKAGAIAIGVVNNASGYFNPAIPGVTMPFIALLQSDTPTFLAAGNTASLRQENLPNPAFEGVATFSAGGPRFGDSFFKPNVSAPGVGISSTASGTGNGAIVESGTSMATPHVAGVAALTREAHPRWREQAIEAAIVQTANPGMLAASDPRLTGTGVVQPVGATGTQVVAFDDDGNSSLSFGFSESTRDYSASRTLTVRNLGHDQVRFNVSYSPATTATGVPHTVTLSRTSLSLGDNDDAQFTVTLRVPVATIGATHDSSGNAVYQDAAGYIVLTPAGGARGAPTLTVPYYLAPRARSRLDANLLGALGPKHPNASLQLSNRRGAIAANADFYAWGLSSPPQGDPYFDTRAVGVQSNLFGSNSLLVFAVNTWTRFSNAAVAEWDVLIDVNGDGQPDFVLFSGDHGYWTTGTFDGTVIDLLYNVSTGQLRTLFYADAPTDGSTVLLPVYASQLGITPSNPSFTYTVQYFNNGNGAGYAMPGQATFNVFSPSITNAAYYTVPPGAAGTVPVAIDPTQWLTSPALGLMIVSEDNASGAPQAELLRANH
jgi:minor extracellular serine protease Vpr